MIGQIVYSKAGRDKGYFLVVVKESENVVSVCDGKERPLERPKQKNTKHICFTKTVLSEECFKTNKSLRKSLAIYRDSSSQEEEP